MEHHNLLRIAQIVSSKFIGKDDKFTAEKKHGYWLLYIKDRKIYPRVKVFEISNKIFSIEVNGINGDYTAGWQDISNETWNKIEDYFLSIEHLY